MTSPIIDAWIQHPTPGFMAHPMFASLRRWMGAETVPDHIPTAFTAAALESAGIQQALVSAWWGPLGPLISNDEVAQFVEERPDLFVGVASVNLADPVAAVAELRRCAIDLRFKAVRALPWLWGWPPNDRHYYPIYVACVELGIPFCLQVGHTGPLRSSEPGRPIPYLDDVALDFPDLVIVAGHIGYPWTDEMIALATKYPNVYIDTSAYKPSRYPPQLVSFMRGAGRKKVLFGSNFPMLMPADCLAQVPDLALDSDALALFLGGNAQRVFRLAANP